jgi:hypothetical protein
MDEQNSEKPPNVPVGPQSDAPAAPSPPAFRAPLPPPARTPTNTLMTGVGGQPRPLADGQLSGLGVPPRTSTNAALPGIGAPFRAPTSPGGQVPIVLSSDPPGALPRSSTGAGFTGVGTTGAAPVRLSSDPQGAPPPRSSTGAGFTGVAMMGAPSGPPPRSSTGAGFTSVGTTGSVWTVEPFAAYAEQRAAQMRLDLSDEANRHSLELEYLAKYVPRGVLAKAWREVLPLAERWTAVAPTDPSAQSCFARARFGASPFLLPTVMGQFATVAAANRKNPEVQYTNALLVWETGDRKAFASALERYAALVPATDTNLQELVARKRSARGDVDSSPLKAAIATAAVLLATLAFSSTIGRQEVSYHPLTAMWLLRHGILLAGAMGLVAATSSSVVNALRLLFTPASAPVLLLAIAGGAGAQGLIQLIYGIGTTPADFSLVVGLAAKAIDAVLLAFFFQFAVQHHFEVAGDRRVGVMVSVLLYWLYAGTYVENWVGTTTFFIWTSLSALVIGVPSALLFASTRSVLPTILWQFSLFALQMVLLK